MSTFAHSERDDVKAWNAEQMQRLSLDPATSALAASAGIDWHDIERLTSLGCSVELALEIVA